ncbi:MAG: vanadium-dependent haloperoxidase [Verrucomicrobiae bacterium]|nr:vanadium-dependent haloperoxidase [Verrucomicrobiae bacterium]
MKIQRLVSTLLTLAALTTPMTVKADEVTDWNQIMQTTVASGNANVQARSGAIVQLAVFEAVNSIIGDYEPYLGTITAPPGASPDAATIAAAHRTLVTLFSGSAGNLNTLRESALAAIPAGPAKEDGIAVGEVAAAAMLLLRANDGAAQAGTTPYTPGTNPGDWQPAPPNFAPASLPGWGLVTPFGMEEGSQFRLPPPPGLRTGKYAHDYNEVKLVGQNLSAFRPQDRTDVARFFAAASPIQTWNPPARQVSLAQGRTLSENARIFALLAMAIADASIATYESKYYYNFWRPLTAIRGGDSDRNHQTDPDVAWSPLLPTPAFPSYPSAHATLSGAARRVLERVFGKQDHAITLTNPTLGLTLNYTEFKQICDDIDDARVYGGIHFRFEQEAGARQGKDVANYILDNYLR